MSAFDDFCNRQTAKQSSDAIGPNVPGGLLKNIIGISIKSTDGFAKGTEGLHGSYIGGLGSVAWGNGKHGAVFKGMAEAHAELTKLNSEEFSRLREAAKSVTIAAPEGGSWTGGLSRKPGSGHGLS